jgi:hypothetical protein
MTISGLLLRGLCLTFTVCVWSELKAGEVTIDGSLKVKTNLTVQGQISSTALSLTNLTISGQATIQNAVIRELEPQGDLSMGPYTNRVAQ